MTKLTYIIILLNIFISILNLSTGIYQNNLWSLLIGVGFIILTITLIYIGKHNESIR